MNGSTTPPRMSSAGKFAWALVALLAIVHYDFWNWDNRSLVFGFMPTGLFFQALISVGAAIAWALVTKFAWPAHIEEWADQPADQPAGTTGADSK
jgi:hypothetical protein